MFNWIRSLNSTELTLALAGGKGANLRLLINAGLPVPPGFCVTTAGYRMFVTANQLAPEIERRLLSAKLDDPAALEELSDQLRALFTAGQLPPALASEICSAYAALNQQSEIQNPQSAVAVRSSATAEDLPDLSFAGQQDTYLNIVGEEALLPAVIRCWASLWTARAIGYRARNHISQTEVALAVVVQQMVPSEASGVLFTANPLTGKRDETVIDATLGLGEALVSGQVEPDHYVVREGRIASKTLGAKALSIRGQAGGGTVTVTESAAAQQALPDEAILALAQLGQRAAQFFKAPQDMEWAWAGGQQYVVQSRPITSLYPLPAWAGADPLQVFLSSAGWQGMLDPFTPLGQDGLGGVVSGGARLFGLAVDIQQQRIAVAAGERIFANLTGLVRQPFTHPILSIFIPAIDPQLKDLLPGLFADPRLAGESAPDWRTRWQIVRGLAPMFFNVLRYLGRPTHGRQYIEEKIATTLRTVGAQCAPVTAPAEAAAVLEAVYQQLPQTLVPVLIPAVIAGQVPLQIILRLAAALPNASDRVMELTRGLPHNVTTEMDLALWQTAQAIRADAAAAARFAQTEVSTLVAEYRAAQLPGVAQAAVAGFMQTYGMRGLAEIDLGRPRWREEPANILQVLQSYLKITDEAAAPETVFRRGAEQAARTQVELLQALRQTPGGWLKARLVQWLASRLRELGGLRETPKFAIIRIFGLVREMLLRTGQRLEAAHTLNQAEDVFFLHVWELKALATDPARDWQALVAERRQTYARELQRKRVPRLMLSDGTAFYEGLARSTGASEKELVGSPVSPGKVEGVAHVILDPRGAQLAPGEILVCPGTDPSWTPLFLAAGGLVMEVGGMMTHGSVVAREYGIPAVVGVSEATTRLKTGQRIRVDGSSGQVVILE